MAEDSSSKKFLVSNFTNYKMTNSIPVMGQYNELLGILRRFTQHKMNMNEAIQVSCIIDKLPPSWKDFKHILKHQKKELTLFELGSRLRVEESLIVHLKKDAKVEKLATRPMVQAQMVQWMDDDVAWLVDSEATMHVCKDRCRDAIFDENIFSSVPIPSLTVPNGTDDIGGSVVLEEVTKEVVQQLKPETRKGKKE
uniref:Zinc finger, CCHC-type n=1 Tax=Tanacetum cinerariifolium TaxID=118510 RepID=A0A6L2MR98_TANCI|nr:zinc finger, CCHC-type [Tanacetum cinerariifolium]